MKKTHYVEQFYSEYADESMSSANAVTDVLLKYIPMPLTVIDVGCGIGTWLKVWQDKGVDVFGVDGNYVNRSQLLIDLKKFTPMDLKSPVPVGQTFELAESLEVAEHLPEVRADSFVEYLCSLSSLILFGAAIPYQGGTCHINEQWPEYWAEKFKKRGYICVDIVRNEVWKDKRCAYYYAQNTFLYVKQSELGRYPALKDAASGTDISRLGRVHPQKWIEANESVLPLGVLVQKFPISLCDFVVRVCRKIKRIVVPS
jgi:SAM-dependent methyltransferase